MSELPVIAEIVTRKLSAHLGPHVARVAVRTFAEKMFARKPEEITAAELPALFEAMRPMLAVMIGRHPSEVVLGEIARECGAPAPAPAG
jgi:hypothetical protein